MDCSHGESLPLSEIQSEQSEESSVLPPLMQQSNSVQDELSSNIPQGGFENVAKEEVVTKEGVAPDPESNDECIPGEGPDSDDECGPFYDAVAGEIQEEGESDNDEEELLPAANPVTPSLTEAEIKKMMIAQL